MLLMLVRVLLSWIPNINWYKEPVFSLKKFTDYIFEPFRKVIPPVGMLDLSPIVAFITIEIIRQLILIVLAKFGL